MASDGNYFTKALNRGHRFNGWTIQSSAASLTVGITDYHDVIQLTCTVDTLTTTKYFAKNIGLIRIEDMMVTIYYYVDLTENRVRFTFCGAFYFGYGGNMNA